MTQTVTGDYLWTTTADHMVNLALDALEVEAFRELAESFARFRAELLRVLPAVLADAILLQYTASTIGMAYNGE